MSNGTSGYEQGTQLTNNFWQTVFPIKPAGKKEGYILIPALGVLNFTSYGVPFVVAIFNYQTSINKRTGLNRNLCIPVIPPRVGGYYNLAIRYNDPSTNQPVRYKFWSFDTNPAQDIPAPVYAGQPIYGANFMIEVWSQGGNPSINMPQNIKLAVSVRRTKETLLECNDFQEGTVTPCSSILSTNGLNIPLIFSACSTGNLGAQIGTNYRINSSSGLFEWLNTTTGLYNPIYAGGIAGQEYLVIAAQDGTYPNGLIPPIKGANYRFNQTTGDFELLNLTIGQWNAINTIGKPGQESIQIQAQDQ